MPTPVPLPSDDLARFLPLDPQTWPRLASRVGVWAERGAVVLRDAVWLLPFSALLPQARKAFAQRGGWSPRIETPATLAVQLGPRAAAADGALSTDPVTRRLQAQAMLRAQAGGPEWARQDPGGFGHAVAALVEAATTWHDALCARAPEVRGAWLEEARSRLAAASGPGERERVLARVGLEWAADSVARQPPASDLLFEARPSAWIALRAGGAQPLVEAVLSHAAAQGVPVCWLDEDPPVESLFDAAATLPPPRELCVPDAEGEARAAASEVLAALARHPEGSVALVAQDREAVRRVRALLDRAGALVVDDTGWRLSTTRAGTRAMALLRAVRALGRRGAGAEDLWLAWLKDDAWAARQADALRALEGLWRGRRLAPWQQEAAEALWAAARQRLEPLQGLRRAPLADWLQALAALWLEEPEDAAFWREDPAGRAVLSAWRLEAPWNQAAGWRALAASTRMDLDELIEWADQALSDESVVPDHPPQARVVITPLARAMLRPFVAAVLPGTDERRLGGAEPGNDLLGPALRRALGIPGADEARAREALAFVQALRLPELTLVRRLADGAEPLGPSALLQRLVLARARAGQEPAALPAARLQLPQRDLVAAPVAEPAPVAPAARWPKALSASAVETWRDCPYRFFAQRVLGLGSDDELDRMAEKRDYGDWLHAVLHHFHQARGAEPVPAEDAARLRASAQAVAADPRLGEGEMLPFLASFETLVEPYLAWLHGREAAGWRFEAGEVTREVSPAVLGGLQLRGRLDRVDAGPGGARQVLDYKTGRSDALKQKVKSPLEDTQLAFYALLMAGEDGLPPTDLGAAYLALDEREAPVEVPHADVADHAQALLAALADEFDRARAGEPLRALGRGPACEHCDMRGLCRRDHWAAPPDQAAEAATEGAGR